MQLPQPPKQNIVYAIQRTRPAPGWHVERNGMNLVATHVARAQLFSDEAEAVLQLVGKADARVVPFELHPHRESPAVHLSPREREVIQLIADDATNRRIATALAISEHTVKFHVNSILLKFDVHSRTAAVVKAVRLGLVR